MVKLTEDMVLARSRASDLETVKKLNCWGNELTDITILRHLPNVEVVSLSVNAITSLREFIHCPQLQELYIRKNAIHNLSEICYLKRLPRLKTLWLADNPAAEVPGYRHTVLRNLPNLTKLDNVAVQMNELNEAVEKGQELSLSDVTSEHTSAPQVTPLPPAPAPEVDDKKDEEEGEVEEEEPATLSVSGVQVSLGETAEAEQEQEDLGETQEREEERTAVTEQGKDEGEKEKRHMGEGGVGLLIKQFDGVSGSGDAPSTDTQTQAEDNHVATALDTNGTAVSATLGENCSSTVFSGTGATSSSGTARGRVPSLLTLEETNKIRAELGLRQLSVDKVNPDKIRFHGNKVKNQNILQSVLLLVRELDADSLQTLRDAVDTRLENL